MFFPESHEKSIFSFKAVKTGTGTHNAQVRAGAGADTFWKLKAKQIASAQQHCP